MTITVNGKTVLQWLPALIPAFVAAYHSIAPQIQNWVSLHPSAAIYIAALIAFVGTLVKSPLNSQNGTLIPGNGTLADAIAKAKAGK